MSSKQHSAEGRGLMNLSFVRYPELVRAGIVSICRFYGSIRVGVSLIYSEESRLSRVISCFQIQVRASGHIP